MHTRRLQLQVEVHRLSRSAVRQNVSAKAQGPGTLWCFYYAKGSLLQVSM